MTPVPACTIVSNNYLAFARVLAESYRRFHPDAPFFVCVVDEPHLDLRYSRLPFTTVFAHEIEIPRFYNFAFRYEIIELNTAVKPFFLSHLRDVYEIDRVFYFDPDILIQDRLDDLARRLDERVAVLTPHITQPLDNDYHPAERTIRQAGVYNLGFLGLRLDERTEDFLDWWEDRLYRYCLVDLPRGVFVDQSWMDLAPAYLDDVEIVRDPVYNVAYWNLAHRFPRRVEGEWHIDDRRIAFTHFSGIDTDDLDPISKHQNRLSLVERPELEPLFDRYRRLLLEAGHDSYRHLPYGYSTFRDSRIRIPSVARKLLRRVDPEGKRWEDPFEIRVQDSYFRWLVEPLEFARGSLNRTVLSLWELRPDLLSAFPQVCDEDLPRYVDWLLHHQGAATAGIDGAFLRGLRGESPGGRARHRGLEILPPHDASVFDQAWEFLRRTDLSNPGGLTEWLNQPVPRARRRPLITYLALLLHQAREDLQHTFPDPCGEDQLEFAMWFIYSGVRDHQLHHDLVAPVLRSFPLRRRLRRTFHFAKRQLVERIESARNEAEAGEAGDAPTDVDDEVGALATAGSRAGRDPGRRLGVNLGAYFGMATGVGQVGRGSAEALQAAGIPVVKVPLDSASEARCIQGRFDSPEGVPFPVTLLHANADQTPHVLARLPTAVAVKSYRIGYWFWELQHFPLAFADRFGRLDEVWAPSRFCQRAFEAIATIPVRHVPPHVPSPGAPRLDQHHFDLDDGRFWFFCCFDMGSVPERKNALGVLEAFRRLCSDVDDDPGLLLKVTRSEFSPEYLAKIHSAARGLPVRIHTKLWSRERMDAALTTCDALLSLHRSEGLGLLPIESLYLETPVVSTAYGGVTDFLDDSNAFLVDYRMQSLDRNHGPYPAGAAWAEPDLEHAVEQMKKVMEFPDEARVAASRGRDRVLEIYGLEASMQRFAVEMERIAELCDLEMASPVLGVETADSQSA